MWKWFDISPVWNGPRPRGARAWRLLRFARPYRAGWVLIGVLTCAVTALSLAQPWPMKLLVDHVLSPGGPAGGVSAALIGAIALFGVTIFGVNAAFEVVLTRSWIRVGQKMVYDLAAEMFARVQRQSLQYHRRHTVGDVMGRITGDSWCVYRLVDACILTPVRALLMLGAAILIMLPMDRWMTVTALLTAPLMAVLNVLLGSRTRKAARACREIEGQIQAHVHQTLTGINVVQAFGREEHEHDRFCDFADRAVKAQQRGVLLARVSELATGAVVSLGTGLVLYMGAHRVLDGSLTIGGLLVFLAYLVMLYDQMKAVMNAYRTVQALGGQTDRVLEVLETAPELPERPGAKAPAGVRGEVRFEDVTFGYLPGRPIIEGVTLQAHPGETIAIVGPTGAGKSTLVSLVPRFADPWQGRVTIDGRDVKELSLRGLRQNVSLVLQDPFLFPLSIADNIAYGRPGASRPEVEAAAKAANAHEFIMKLPGGYDAVVGERGATLSGGERQRISIARALLKDAPILILDEPTSALDAQTEGLLLDALRVLMRGRTTLVIAHRLSTIRSTDQIVVLESGRIRESGTHEQLLVLGGLYAEMNGAPAGASMERTDTLTVSGSNAS